MGCTSQELLDVCHKALDEGWLYVYGACGHPLTRSDVAALQAQYGSDCVWDSDIDKGGTGVPCCDCSGLIDYATGDDSSSGGYHDSGGQDVSPSEAEPGYALWLPGHIGVYVGSGRYMAMDGSARDAWCGPLSDNAWQAAFPLSQVDYSGGCSWDGAGGGGSSQPWLDSYDGFEGAGVEYRVALDGGWLPWVSRASAGDDGYAGDGGRNIDGIEARLADGTPVRLVGTSCYGGTLEGDGHIDLFGEGTGAFDTLTSPDCKVRVAIPGGDYFGWCDRGSTPEGDGYAGEPGTCFCSVQMCL